MVYLLNLPLAALAAYLIVALRAPPEANKRSLLVCVKWRA